MKSTSWVKNFIVKWALSSALLFTSMWACAQPVSRFSATTLSGCAPILVQFSDASTGNPNYWKWDLGNGTISYLQNPSVTYFTPGNYTIKLLVKSAAGGDSLVKTDYVRVYASPVVSFTASHTSACNTLSTNFINQSNSGNSWQWDLGDGVFSFEKNPSHTYTQTGNYNVSLKVTNAEGCHTTLLKQAYIQVNSVKAGFSNRVTVRCTPTKINFQNKSTGNGNVEYKWLFGNGDSANVKDPEYSYSTGGVYTVRLFVKNEYGCADVFDSTITVTHPVTAAFTASTTNACKVPAAIQFNNGLLNGNTYAWNFGDTVLSTAANPTHTFRDTGRYTVKLVVRNSNGCVDSLTKVGYITIQKPFVSLQHLPDSGCAPFTKQFAALATGGDSVVQYQWHFGDGETSSMAAPAHVYAAGGYNTVSLITTGISGCKDTVSVTGAIRASNRPVAAFSADTRNACSQTGISFTDESTGAPNRWQWDFGDNSYAIEQHPVHVFRDSGFLYAQLIAFSGGCSDTLRKNDYVYIKPAVSKFKFDITCANPFYFVFNNHSIGADMWEWDFGDGHTSNALNPVHTYADTGNYSVSLTSQNISTGCGYKLTKWVKVARIHPDFFTPKTTVCEGEALRFTSTIDAANASRFIWDFGDGTVDNTYENTVTHVYEQSGRYTVRLITVNLVNCRDTIIKTDYVTVNGLTANFATGIQVACSNTAVVFNDSSSTKGLNTIQRWQWNYGDGTVETVSAPPFTHSYNRAGNFAVSLTVTDAEGCSDTHLLELPLTIKKISAFFAAYDTVKCTGDGVAFVCPFSEPGISYRWDFGDGGTATTQAPRHTYTASGMYNVKLHISHTAGCEDSSVRSNYIKIDDPLASFTMSDSFRNCPPLIVQFSNQSLNAQDALWDFGDGSTTPMANPSHFYSYPGVYTASLTVKGNGCTRRMEKQIVVKGPQGSLSYTPLNFCEPASATFRAHTTDAASFLWDFNDGVTLVNTDSVVTHRYLNSGKYVPKLILTDYNGCNVPIAGTDTINIVQLDAGFEFADRTFCNADPVSFSNTSVSSETIRSSHWDFGDGFFADNFDAAHDYQLAGTYYPMLVVTTVNGCVDSFVTAEPLVVAASPDAIIQSTGNGCTPLTGAFYGVINDQSVPITKWHWDFGNGNTSAQQNPTPQNYQHAGNYTVQLTVTSAAGCEQRTGKILEAFPVPALEIAGNTSICKGQSTRLTASGADIYSWAPSTELTCAGCASAIVSPAVNTIFTVVGTNQYGCSTKDSVGVKVQQPFTMRYPGNATVCAGGSVMLPATGADRYRWSPSTGLDNIQASSPVSQPGHSTTYRVIGADEMGCFSDTGFITVTVNALPFVNAGTDRSIDNGSSTDLVPVVSADVTAISWSPTSSVFRQSGNTITVKPAVTTEYEVAVKNNAGCTASDKVTVTVTAAGGEIFIPNSFSPNADGANDIFYPRSATGSRINRLTIFNRNGVVVFEKKNFYTNDAGSGWNGTAGGIKLAADVYVYALEMTGSEGKTKVLSGNVSLLR